MVPILSGSDIVSGHLVCTFLMQVLLVYRWPKACDSVCVCVCVCERLGIFVQPPYTAGRARSFSMTDAALPSQMTAVFMEMHFFSR